MLQIIEFETQVDEIGPVPEHGESLAEKVGHDSLVPLKAEQGVEAPIQPANPFQMQFLIRPVGGYQIAQAALLVAIIF